MPVPVSQSDFGLFRASALDPAAFANLFDRASPFSVAAPIVVVAK